MVHGTYFVTGIHLLSGMSLSIVHVADVNLTQVTPAMFNGYLNFCQYYGILFRTNLNQASLQIGKPLCFPGRGTNSVDI